MKPEIRKLGMKIARQESDKLHNKQCRNLEKITSINKDKLFIPYKDFMDACLKCFEEGYKLRGIQDVNKLAKLHNQEKK